MSDNKLRLCEPAIELDAEVIRVYEAAFPPAERQPVETLKKFIAEKRTIVHRTNNEAGELLCFTLVMLCSDFTFLSYMATDATKRSSGVGSKHLTRLLEILKERFPNHIGLFFEIESTRPKAEVLNEEDRITRSRRKVFYERLGARELCEEGVYLTPHFADRNKEWEGELMAFEFGEQVCGDQLRDVILEVYDRCYSLKPDHPLVQKVLQYFRPCTISCDDENCARDIEAGTCQKKPDTTPSDKPADGKSDKPADGKEPSKSDKPADKAGDQPAESTDEPAEEKEDCGCLVPKWWQWLLSILWPKKG